MTLVYKVPQYVCRECKAILYTYTEEENPSVLLMEHDEYTREESKCLNRGKVWRIIMETVDVDEASK